MLGQTEKPHGERVVFLRGGGKGYELEKQKTQNPDMLHKTHSTKEKPVWIRYFANENFLHF